MSVTPAKTEWSLLWGEKLTRKSTVDTQEHKTNTIAHNSTLKALCLMSNNYRSIPKRTHKRQGQRQIALVDTLKKFREEGFCS